VDILGHLTTLQHFSHPKHKLVLILSPTGQGDIVHDVLVLPEAQVVLISVLEKLRKEVKLRDELFEVT
jgi:hypothetical protein